MTRTDQTNELLTSLSHSWTLRLLVLIPALAFAVLGLIVHPWFFAAAVVSLLPALWITLFFRRRGGLSNSPNRITDAQVFALVRSSGGRLTAARLASATNSTVDAARRRLKQLASESILDVEATDTDLIYGFAKSDGGTDREANDTP